MINLAPPDIRQQVKYGRYNVAVVQYLVGVVFVALVLAVIIVIGNILLNSKIDSLQVNLDENSAAITQQATILSEARELEETINTIKALLDREVIFSELLLDIAALVPKGATLDSISLSNELYSLNLATTLDSQGLAAVFQKNLAESELFAVADIISLTEAEGTKYRSVLSVVFVPDQPATTNAEGEVTQ